MWRSSARRSGATAKVITGDGRSWSTMLPMILAGRKFHRIAKQRRAKLKVSSPRTRKLFTTKRTPRRCALTVEFSARFRATIHVAVYATAEEIQDIISDIDVPENE